MADSRAPTVDKLCTAVASVSVRLLNLSLATLQFAATCCRACFDIQNKTSQVRARAPLRVAIARAGPRPGSGSHLHCILARLFAAAGRDLGSCRGRLYWHVGQ